MQVPPRKNNTVRILIYGLIASLALLSVANAQTTRLAFTSDDFVVTPVFNDVAVFTFDIEIDAPLEPGVFDNPQLVRVIYTVEGELAGTPSGFPAFALRRDITGTEFYAQGSSLSFEVRPDAVITDGIQVAELAGNAIVFTFNGKEIGNGRFHPALLELNANGAGRIQNSDNVIAEDPFQQVDFGEEYITDLAFDPGNLTLLASIDPVPPIQPPRSGGGGALSPMLLALLLLLGCIQAVLTHRRKGKAE